MFDSFRNTMREGKVTDKHDVMSKLFSGMISSNTTIKYHAVFLNKTITSFRLNYAVFKKKINPFEAGN